MERKRDLSFDFIKGVLIILVVYGHCLNQMHYEHNAGLIDLWIYSFHMPLFVFLSGLFAPNSLNKGLLFVLKSKFRRLFVPALFWSLVIFLENMCLGREATLRMFYDSCRGLWFLWCLQGVFFLSSVVWNKGWYPFLLSAFLLILWPWYPNDLLKHFKIPYYFPIFYVGAYLRNSLNVRLGGQFLYKEPYRVKIWLCFFIYLFFFTLYLVKNEVQSWYFYMFLLYASSVPIYFFLLKRFYDKYSYLRIVKYISVIGNSTLGIYVLNERIIMPVSQNCIFPLHSELLVLMISLVITVVCFGGTCFMRKTKITKLLLGEK